MDYKPEPIEIKDKQVALLRKALQPILKDAIAKEGMQAFAESFYKELTALGDRLDKRIDANKPKDVDMNPVAELLSHVLALSKREIQNNIEVQVPEIAALTEKIDGVMDFMKTQQAEAAAQANDKEKELPKVHIANMDEFKMPDVHVTSGAKHPFINPDGQGNVALRLANTSSGVAMPVVIRDQSVGSSGGRSWVLASGTDFVNIANFPTIQTIQGLVGISGQVTISGTVGGTVGVVGSVGRTWTLASGQDMVGIANFPTIQTVQGRVDRAWTLTSGVDSILAARNWTLASGLDNVNIGNFPTIQTVAGQLGRTWVLASGIDNVSIANFPTIQTVQGQVEIANDVGSPIPVSLSATVTTSGVPTYPNAFDNNVVRATSSGVAVQGQTSPLSGQAGAVVQALAANQGNVKVGNATRQTFELQPGQATGISVANISQLYLIADFPNDGICWIAS